MYYDYVQMSEVIQSASKWKIIELVFRSKVLQIT